MLPVTNVLVLITFAALVGISVAINKDIAEHHHLHHHAPDDHTQHEHPHTEATSGSSGSNEERLPEDAGEPIIHHVCIHDQLAASGPVPVVPQSYLVDPPWKVQKHLHEHKTNLVKSGAVSDDAMADSHKSTEVLHRRLEEATVSYQNIRVKYFFNVDNLGYCASVGTTVSNYQGSTSYCNTTSVLTSMKRDYILNTLMPAAVALIQSALNVIPVNGTLIAPASCHGITTPASHQTTGVSDADFVAYVTAVPLASSSNAATVAWALSCANDQNGRPTFGQINFVPSALSNADVRKEYVTQQDIKTAVHEASHALGFSSTYFGKYVDASNVYHASGGTTSYTDSTLGKTVTKIVSPRAVAAARTFFGCNTLDGVEIEDQGGAGTQGSHWEKRILYTEYMSGMLSSIKTYISSITLGYFEDTGFYTANYGAAESNFMSFGKGRGCTFVTQKCTTVSSPEFCFEAAGASSHMYCSTDYYARGYCSTTTYSTAIPNEFQYFGNSVDGGYPSLPDYCPTGLPYSNFVCIDGSASDSQDIYGNTYGASSRCFQSNIIKSGYSADSASYEARCFPVRCSSAGRILIDVQGQVVLCPTDGSAGAADTSSLSGYTGTIVCPASSSFCIDPSVPTPAPPPTPAPAPTTPAPPGFTPQPAPLYHAATPSPTIADTCAGRYTSANSITVRLPWCRSFAATLIDVFGTSCDAKLAQWLSDNNALCTDSYAWGNANCVEGPAGGAAMCALVNVI